MDTKVTRTAFLEKFRELESSFNPEVDSYFNKLDESFSANELCEKIIEQFWLSENIPKEEQNADEHCMKSSIFCVACLKMGLLDSPYMKEYAEGRGGVLYLNYDKKTQTYNSILLCKVIDWMISQ